VVTNLARAWRWRNKRKKEKGGNEASLEFDSKKAVTPLAGYRRSRDRDHKPSKCKRRASARREPALKRGREVVKRRENPLKRVVETMGPQQKEHSSMGNKKGGKISVRKKRWNEANCSEHEIPWLKSPGRWASKGENKLERAKT